jgi:alcohol dehydrogenase class IV
MSLIFNPIQEVQTFQVPKMIFGIDAANRIGDEARKLGGKSALLVSEKGVEKIHGDMFKEALEKHGYSVTVFTEIDPDPWANSANKGSEIAREGKCDLVLGLGGGSSMDVAKAVSVLATNPVTSEELMKSGGKIITKRGLPKILLPTTAGTASETNPICMLRVEKEKMGLRHPYFYADLAIVDPLLTMTLPPRPTAYTGMDCLSHATARVLAPIQNPLYYCAAMEAIRIVGKYLRVAYNNGTNLVARYYMSYAASMALMGSAPPSGGLGYPYPDMLTNRFNTPHGLAEAIFLPYSREQLVVVCPEKLVEVAKAFGENTEGLTLREGAYKAIWAMKKLVEDLGLPSSLKDAGVPREALQEMINDSASRGDSMHPYAPVRINRENATKLFERAWEGKIGD